MARCLRVGLKEDFHSRQLGHTVLDAGRGQGASSWSLAGSSLISSKGLILETHVETPEDYRLRRKNIMGGSDCWRYKMAVMVVDV
jgi:hypothetical protein